MQDLHSFSPFGALRHHLPPAERWDNKAPRGCNPICGSILCTGCCAPACGGKVVAPATKGGNVFPRPQGRLFGFIQTGGAAAHHNPLNLLHLLNPMNPRSRRPLREYSRHVSISSHKKSRHKACSFHLVFIRGSISRRPRRGAGIYFHRYFSRYFHRAVRCGPFCRGLCRRGW